MDFSNKEKELLDLITSIRDKLDKFTRKKFKRVNPLNENLIDWKTKGEQIFGKKNITIYDSSTVVGDVEIGKDTWIGPFTSLDGSGGLKIGSNCSISSKVDIVSHDTIKWALSQGKAPYEYAPITIGDNCFIGTGATICKGVTIGSHSLIAAGAVVNKSFPSFSIIGGVPAQLIGRVILNEYGEPNLIYNGQ